MFKARLSVLTQLAAASKRIARDPEGGLVKTPPAITSALVRPRLWSAHELAHAVNHPDTLGNYIKWATPVTGPERAWALTEQDLREDRREARLAALAERFGVKEPLHVIGLGRHSFRRPEGGGWLAIDIDPPAGVSFSEASALEALARVVPTVHEAPRVVYHSSSGWIYETATGRELAGARGLRVVLGIAEAGDTARAGQVLFDRLWLAGLGWMLITRSGDCLPRTLVDLAVTRTASQPDFFLPGRLGEGLEYRRPGATACDGFPLYTREALPDLSAAERVRLREIQAEAAAERAEEAAAIRRQHFDSLAEANARRSGRSLAHERAVLERLRERAGAVVEIDGDHPVCTRRHGWLTVREIGARGIACFEDPYCADPIEPHYGGVEGGAPTVTKARITVASAEAVEIQTFAHGSGRRYRWIGLEGIVFEPDGAPETTPPEADPWDGTGTAPGAWDGTLGSEALDAEALLAAAVPDVTEAELARLAEILEHGTATRSLRGGATEGEGTRFARLKEDLQAHLGDSVAGVALARRDRTNSVLHTHTRREAPLAVVGERSAVGVPGVLGAASETARALVTVVAATPLATALAEVRAAVATGQRIELLVAQPGERAVALAALREAGVLAELRPGYADRAPDGSPLCLKFEAHARRREAEAARGGFRAHCRGRDPKDPEKFEFCPHFATCGHNQRLRELDVAEVIVASPFALEREAGSFFEASPPPHVVVAGALAGVTPRWEAARIEARDCAPFREAARTLQRGAREGLSREALLSLLTREERAAISAQAEPPRAARPRYSVEQAREATRALLRPYATEGLAAPWTVASALEDALLGRRVLVHHAAADQYLALPVPRFERLAQTLSLTHLAAEPLGGELLDRAVQALDGAAERAAKRLGTATPTTATTATATVVHRLRAPVRAPAGFWVLSLYPRARLRDLRDPTAQASLAALASHGARAGARVALIVVEREACAVLRQRLAGTGVSVLLPSEDADLGPLDVIVQTAAVPLTHERAAALSWAARGSREAVARALVGAASWRAPLADLLHPSTHAQGILLRRPDDPDTWLHWQVEAYQGAERLARASVSAGREPVVLLLDVLPPAYPVAAQVPRGLLLPGPRELALLETRRELPLASDREIARELARAHPALFASWAAARAFLQRHERVPGCVELRLACLGLWAGRACPDLQARVEAYVLAGGDGEEGATEDEDSETGEDEDGEVEDGVL